MSALVFTADDLPLLGEPIAVEFANSLYQGEETIDFLSSKQNIELWFETAEKTRELHVPSRLTARDIEKLAALRGVIRALLLAAVSKEPLPAKEVRALNEFAAIAPSFSMLTPAGEGFIVSTVASEKTLDGLLGRLAHEAIILLGENSKLLRQCATPGCPMLFVQDHHRRRWCHESCGHRSRQAAYYQRKLKRSQ
jgi:predicted RNA-binding Zn ribbon-like protein